MDTIINRRELRRSIWESPYTFKVLADKLDIAYFTFMGKLNGYGEFTNQQILILKQLGLIDKKKVIGKNGKQSD